MGEKKIEPVKMKGIGEGRASDWIGEGRGLAGDGIGEGEAGEGTGG
jgi:hypothetical protein